MNKFIQYSVLPGPLKVRDIMAMNGANYFSGGPVVIIKLDLGEYDEVFTNKIKGFYENLKESLPSLHEHHCSPGVPGGFLQRVREGTLLGHVTEHTAIELQTIAGMDVAYGKTRSTNTPGVYNVVFRFMDEMAGVYAGKAAVNLVNALLTGASFDVERIIGDLVDIREKRLLGPTTQALVAEAAKRDIPSFRLDSYNLVQLGSGKYQKRIRAALSSDTGFIAVETVDNKHLTCRMLDDAGIPVPATNKVEKAEDALVFQAELGKPVVIKPSSGCLGNGVSVNPETPEQMVSAFEWAASFDSNVLVQENIPGNAYRLLIIDFQFVAAVKLMPPSVTGDGVHTIRELTNMLNNDPHRGIGDKLKLTKVQLDDVSLRIISDAGFEPESVLPGKKVLPLKRSGSLKLGGSAIDVTNDVHEMNRFLAERACRVTGLDTAGVDMIAPTLSSPILENGGAVIEINAAPDFRMHIQPTVGRSRNVASRFIDMLFPHGARTRAPLFSVTGSYGKTEAAQLMAYCLSLSGSKPGLANSQGLFISGKLMKEGDMTDPENVGLILREAVIDCAVVEIPCEAILRKGLGYEYADFGIILNIYNRKIDCDYADSLEDMAYAKSTVAEQVYGNGYCILNADSDLVMEMSERAGGQVVVFSRSRGNRIVDAQLRRDRIALAVDNGEIAIFQRSERYKISNVSDIPLLKQLPETYGLDVVLASVAALYASGISPDTIRTGVEGFES